jgi:hypothetical protein
VEFILNKIDTDIRRRHQEEIKEGKVHNTKGINVNKDPNEKNENGNGESHSNEKKQKKYITIDGMKLNGERMSVEVEKLEKIDEENSRGRILDAKK